MILRRVPSICHPVAEAIDEIPVVGIGHVLVGMRRASALYLGMAFVACWRHSSAFLRNSSARLIGLAPNKALLAIA
jgi:hypothetical protein